MKLIADIGTNPKLIKIDVTDILLHHFLKHYDDIGVTEFILHGNDVVVDAMKSNYKDLYNINFTPITTEEFFNYRKRDCDMHDRLKGLGQLGEYNQQPPSNHICPLWIIQNDLKKQYLTENELCFILDLDEFVDLSSTELTILQDHDIEFCIGVLRDRIGKSENDLISLNKKAPISEQLSQYVDITSGIAKRASNKVIITKGYLEHCFGHHGLYKKSDNTKSCPSEALTVYHYKYFKQNLEGGLGPHGKKEQAYLNDLYDK
jgi:hypothetical protein